MAIDRTPFNALVDDDGTNTVGSIWNKNAIKTVILDPVDGLGVWASVPYNGANFSSNNGPGYWTVEAADVGAYLYTVIGKSMWLTFHITGTSVTGSPYELRLKIPGGYTAAVTAIVPALSVFDAAWSAGFVALLGTEIGLRKDVSGATTWGTSTNGTHISGTLYIPLS